MDAEEKSLHHDNTRAQAASEDQVARHTPTANDAQDELVIRLEPVPTWRLTIILASIGMGLLVSIMDTTIVATMLFTISSEFGDFDLLPWVVVAYTLSYVGEWQNVRLLTS